MLQPLLLIIGLIPLVFKLGPLILPETWLESYAYWDADSLNQAPGKDGRQAQWRNMGSWRVSPPLFVLELSTQLNMACRIQSFTLRLLGIWGRGC